jgi:hypothetical protein
MNKRVAILVVYCLATAAYAVVQSTPQNPPASGQASPAPQADTQSTPKTDDAANSKNAKAQPATAPAAAPNLKIPSGSKIYVAPMAGFENYVVAGIMKKKVPVSIVNDRDKADYEINGAADTQKAGWAKIVFLKTDATTEEATINVTEIKTGAIVFAYSVHKGNSARGKQSAGEAIGKHLNEAIGKN